MSARHARIWPPRPDPAQPPEARPEPPQHWSESAACTGVDPDLFFPEVGQEKAAQAARGVCATCPVRRECLEYALETRQEHGIWGGTTRDERRALNRAAGMGVAA